MYMLTALQPKSSSALVHRPNPRVDPHQSDANATALAVVLARSVGATQERNLANIVGSPSRPWAIQEGNRNSRIPSPHYVLTQKAELEPTCSRGSRRSASVGPASLVTLSVM